MSQYAYVAKAPVSSDPEFPEFWPDDWEFPIPPDSNPELDTDDTPEFGDVQGPWPPGWPIDIEAENPGTDYSIELTAADTIDPDNSSTLALEARILDSGSNTDDLEWHLLCVMAVKDDEIVGIKKESSDSYSDAIYYQVENYSGAKYGFQDSVYLDLAIGDIGENVKVYAAVISIDPFVEDMEEVEVVEAGWTARSVPASAWSSVCWAPALNLFCAVATSGSNQVMTSPDGITWTARTASEVAEWRTICWSEELGLFCAMATDIATYGKCMTSPDGINWTSRTIAAGFWLSVCYSPEQDIFFTGSSGSVAGRKSANGIDWSSGVTLATHSSFKFIWVAELSLFVSVGGSTKAQTSPTGTTWTQRNPAETNQWKGLCWAPSLGLLVAVSTNGTNRVMTSSNGTSWTSRSASEANSWVSVCWSPELAKFVAVSADGTNRVMLSSDGITWTAIEAAEQNTWADVCWSPELGIFAAVSSDGTNRVMTSATGN